MVEALGMVLGCMRALDLHAGSGLEILVVWED